jgi:hypothetical protein
MINISGKEPILKNLLFFIFILILACSSSKKVSKETTPIETRDSISVIIGEIDTVSNYYLFDYINGLDSSDYYTLLDSIKNGTSDDFFTLRMAYTKTMDYTPYDSRMGDLYDQITALIDSSAFPEATLLCDSILQHKYVDELVHLYLGYIYLQTGDSVRSDYHYDCYDGLLNSIEESGDGRAPKTAYIVIETREEYVFLDWYYLEIKSQSLVNKDGYSFDLLNAYDPEQDKDFEVYFNIQIPFSYLKSVFPNKNE